LFIKIFFIPVIEIFLYGIYENHCMAGIIGWIDNRKMNRLSPAPFDEYSNSISVKFFKEDIEGATMGIYTCDPHRRNQLLRFDDQFIISADADIYNPDELKEKLQIDRHRVLTTLELLFFSYRHWGRDCVHHLQGDFAFVIWDAVANELFCARDPFGARSLYYSLVSGIFLFSSELRFLKQICPWHPEVDEEFLHDTLVSAVSDKHLTAFRSIYRLPPACHITYKDEKFILTKYWKPALDQYVKFHNPKDYAEMLKEQIMRSVYARLQGAEIVGAELSGGLDSSLIACIAQDQCNSLNLPFYALSNVLPYDYSGGLKDEREFIQTIIESRKMSWIEISDTPHSIMDILAQQLFIQGSFVQQRFGIFNQELYKSASLKGIRVLLSGFGGDEMISARIAAPWYDMIADHCWKSFFTFLFYERNPLRSSLKAFQLLVKYIFWDFLVSGKLTGISDPKLETERFLNLAINRQYAENNKLHNRFLEKRMHFPLKYLSQRQIYHLDHQHLPQRLEYCYSSAAYHNIQYRYPFLDTRVIEAYLSIPANVRYGADGKRTIFRMAMKGIVPETICQRNDKSGNTIPYFRLKPDKERDLIISFINECSIDKFLPTVFDFSKFPDWLNKLVKRLELDELCLMPGAFYNYLMIMLYFKKYG
jgi:asparagine synthase (glutamine-hydrolysing)